MDVQGFREAYRHNEFWSLIACSRRGGGGNGSAAQDTGSAALSDTLAPCRVGLLARSLHCSSSRVLGRVCDDDAAQREGSCAWLTWHGLVGWMLG
jgi:hypothetical protein